MSLDLSSLSPTDRFVHRHVGPRASELPGMLKVVGASSLDDLVARTVPENIRLGRALNLPPARSEAELLDELRDIASKNEVFRSFIGMGYHDTFTPGVIQRNVLENPGWYTQYTPYQSEISQGRLEALLNYQTMVIDLTGMEIANASLLDEGTAAAEAMAMLHRLSKDQSKLQFLVASNCHPQTIEVVKTRAVPLGVEVVVADPSTFRFGPRTYGALVQYPDTFGSVETYAALCDAAHAAGAAVAVASDLLALTLLSPPGEWGADVVVGNSQRFGVPFGYGGPHAAFFATKTAHQRQMPGRLIGVSRDARGKMALRMALGTREQHIRREKATSNICTAQVLLAVMAGMYAVYHGPEGLKAIATRVHGLAKLAAAGLEKLGARVTSRGYFDTLTVELPRGDADAVHAAARAKRMNFRALDARTVGLAFDECKTVDDVRDVLACFNGGKEPSFSLEQLASGLAPGYSGGPVRTSAYLAHPVFTTHHSETEMLRYIRKLESRDLSLTASMIPLGSCTMKLNATMEMFPVTWASFGRIHPFAPVEQAAGYRVLFDQLTAQLGEITGLPAVSLQPNSGAQGEYAGLLVIRAYHQSRGESHRNVCLIPSSAHGTNPASAAMAGMEVVVVKCDDAGNVDLADLKARAEQHREKLAALMVTYPSTHGVFEEAIKDICAIVHANGGQVYMDGANLNAQVGLCRPGDIGADVCHVNLHKTFCIPHGGGGPGMGPICVQPHLARFLPGHPIVATGGEAAIGPISAAPWGSASILTISWMYIRAMGPDGLTHATKMAILNANYVAKRLEKHFPVLYVGKNGTCAHECIFDNRAIEKATGVTVEDIAKRLMDYGFHAPTVSFPVAGTLMVEPTESEPKSELDRFCDALIAIRAEIAEIESGKADRANNLLKNAPHPASTVASTEWPYPYPRERAAYPVASLRDYKFWTSVARVDNPWGDRNLVCACPPMEAYT